MCFQEHNVLLTVTSERYKKIQQQLTLKGKFRWGKVTNFLSQVTNFFPTKTSPEQILFPLYFFDVP